MIATAKHKQIFRLITEIRESHSEMTNIFTLGSCFNMFKILRVLYPESVAWNDLNHIITEIDGRFYDITGEVKRLRHVPMAKIYSKRRGSRAISWMAKNEFDIVSSKKLIE